MTKKLAIFLIPIIVTSCSGPEIVDTGKITDEKLSCNELLMEIQKCDIDKQRISEEKGLTAKNIGMALICCPTLIMSNSDINASLASVNTRKSNLVNIYSKKNALAVYRNYMAKNCINLILRYFSFLQFFMRIFKLFFFPLF